MSRSTVQDKISGRNAPRLWQILVLVRACADYAASIGAPLPPEDTDEQVWRELVHAAVQRTPRAVADEVTASIPVSANHDEDRPARWNLEPLIRAGMHDMVELVKVSENVPLADWLPSLAEALDTAGMSTDHFLTEASLEPPQQLVDTIMALATENFEGLHQKNIDRLMYLSVKNQPANSVPIIVALLRRRSGEGAEIADDFIALTSGDGNKVLIRDDCFDVVLALRGATMTKDASLVLIGIGKYGRPDYIFRVASSLPDDTWGDRETVLNSAGQGSIYHTCTVIQALQGPELNGLDPTVTLDRIIFGIPRGSHKQVSSYLEKNGFQAEATRILELENEPPF
jgi:hypothetical protein